MSRDSIRNALGEFGREEFADWLWRGLIRFYTLPPTERRSAFDYVGSLIMQQESVFEGLALIYYEYVPESRKLIFRQAIGDVLRNQAKNQDAPIQAFRDLIYLIARVRATESLTALLPTVGNGRLGKRDPDVFYDALAALRSLAPATGAYKTAFGLIDSANFDDGYLFEAMKVSVECEPLCASTIVLKLEPRLTCLRQDAQSRGGDEWRAFRDAAEDWARHMLKLGPTFWLNDLWEKANHSVDQLWLFVLLFSNETFPVKLTRDEPSDSCFIEHRSKKVLLKVSDKDYWTRQRLLGVAAYQEAIGWAIDPSDKVNSFLVLVPIKSGSVRQWDSLGNQIYSRQLRHIAPKVTLGYPQVANQRHEEENHA